MKPASPSPDDAHQNDPSTLLQALVCVALLIGLAAEMAPAINESHYLPKAKHVWDASFAPQDLFLESHDSHFLASLLAGIPAQFLSLAAVAWIGRLISWTLMAFAWIRLGEALRVPVWIRPLALAGWFVAMEYGHWAGEWAIGGFEAKSIAYPLVLFGLAHVVANRWSSAWPWLAAAVAWHPVVGGWAGLSCGIVWLALPSRLERLREQVWPLLLAVAIGLIGVVPAALGLGGANQIDKVVASQIHVYMRLPHHLCPQLFAPERNWAAMGSMLGLLATSALVVVWRRRFAPRLNSGNAQHPELAQHSEIAQRLAGTVRLLQIAWISVAFAFIGWLIDWTLTSYRPSLASQLLRFYWFRWADVAVPLASVIAVWQFLAATHGASTGKDGPPATSPRTAILLPSIGLSVATLGIVVTCGLVVIARWQQEIPAADRLVAEFVGPHVVYPEPVVVPIEDPGDPKGSWPNTEITSAELAGDDVMVRTPEMARYIDWLAACDWIRQHTPQDSLWLTPKYQQTFKWHAGRAEVVAWKDVPQDNASVHEWYQRIKRLEPPRRGGVLRPWSTGELLELAQEYGFRYVLLDRSIQTGEPPQFEYLYPAFEDGRFVENRSFAVMRVRESMLRAAKD